MVNENWNELSGELASTKVLYHNDDYFEFLVQRVWKFTEPMRIVDFGCGFGYMGLKLLPLLPFGCKYVGIDKAGKLLEKGKELFAEAPFDYEFIESDIREVPLEDDSFDLAISRAVLMHTPEPERAVSEMVRLVGGGGMVIACEGNRNAHTAAFYIHETEEQETTPLDFFQQMNKGIREQVGIDYNIGYKLPVLFKKAGLINVQARTDDKVNVLLPPLAKPEDLRVFEAICSEGMGEGKITPERYNEKMKILLKYGLSREEIEFELQREADRDFGVNGKNWHTVYPGLMTWAWGSVVG